MSNTGELIVNTNAPVDIAGKRGRVSDGAETRQSKRECKTNIPDNNVTEQKKDSDTPRRWKKKASARLVEASLRTTVSLNKVAELVQVSSKCNERVLGEIALSYKDQRKQDIMNILEQKTTSVYNKRGFEIPEWISDDFCTLVQNKHRIQVFSTMLVFLEQFNNDLDEYESLLCTVVKEVVRLQDNDKDEFWKDTIERAPVNIELKKRTLPGR